MGVVGRFGVARLAHEQEIVEVAGAAFGGK